MYITIFTEHVDIRLLCSFNTKTVVLSADVAGHRLVDKLRFPPAVRQTFAKWSAVQRFVGLALRIKCDAFCVFVSFTCVV